MTIYTTMPLELVLDGMNNDPEPLQEVWAAGVKMQILPVSPGVGKIVRLIDCSLNDYLRPELTPGSLISLHAN